MSRDQEIKDLDQILDPQEQIAIENRAKVANAFDSGEVTSPTQLANAFSGPIVEAPVMPKREWLLAGLVRALRQRRRQNDGK